MELLDKEGYEFYKIFQAVQLHFKPGNYDYFLYHGSTRLNENSFLKCKGKYFYEKFGRKITTKEDREFLIACNFYFKDMGFIAQLDVDILKNMKFYKKSIQYFFKESLQVYKGMGPSDIIETEDYELKHNPHLYLIIMNIITGGYIFKMYDEKYQDDFLWLKEYKPKLINFEPFVRKYFDFIQLNSPVDNKKILLDILKGNI